MSVMRKIIILGLFVAISMSFGTMPTAEAEPIPSPYQQVRDGVPIGEIVCSGARILMQSPSGMPACVYFDTVKVLQDRSWSIVENAQYSDIIGSETITIQSAPIMGAAAKTGELGFHDAYCRYQDAISLEVPNRVKVGEVFNVTVAFSFAEDSELDTDYWNDNCYGFVQVRYPPNYQATGEGLVQSHTYVHEGYDPPIVSHGMIYPEIAYGQQPLTFQMQINESRDGVYDVGARVASTRSSDYNITSYVAKDYPVYDFGSFTVARGHNVVSASVYTLISDGIVAPVRCGLSG